MNEIGAIFLYFFLWLAFVFIFFWIVQVGWNYGVRVISNERVPYISYSTAGYLCLFFMAFFALCALTLRQPKFY